VECWTAIGCCGIWWWVGECSVFLKDKVFWSVLKDNDICGILGRMLHCCNLS